MKQTVFLAILFFAFTAWADEPDVSQLEARLQETKLRLGLTEEQMAQLKPVLTDHFDAQMAVLDKHGIAVGNRGDRGRLGLRKLRALRRDMDKISDNTSKRLSGILSKAQLAEFEKIQKEQRDQMREKLR